MCDPRNMYTGLRIDGDGDEDEDRKKQQRWTPNRCYDMCYDMRGGSVLGFPTRRRVDSKFLNIARSIDRTPSLQCCNVPIDNLLAHSFSIPGSTSNVTLVYAWYPAGLLRVIQIQLLDQYRAS